ncbi:hypothetical protein COK34_06930 [Bacillus thuringiensis]|uniref:hypothetical protein n=1 Tax=Bacillus thuringiensis TaxID=1428 RepID=UPI000BF70793|nr:hypothetical protein [Bacillus thuringiensis]PFD66888.1 hypothetical protein CN309_08450 [Bacillus thuringiensis]PFO46543.1 hypothetical protein COJ84_01385 [Bacillus thuringiensis]PFR56343.1 hypothetical protein COK34_06930 [Bacillus thuringiensis]
MTFEERRILRERIIRDLYNDYFENVGREQILKFNLDDIEEKEKHLAYQYWEGKKLINYRLISKDGLYGVKINSYGIDYVEK